MSAAEKLRTLEGAASTPKPWRLETRPVPNKNEAIVWNGQGQAIAHDLHDDDARLITTLRNALPQIVALVGWAEKFAEFSDYHGWTDEEHPRLEPELDAALAALDEALS